MCTDGFIDILYHMFAFLTREKRKKTDREKEKYIKYILQYKTTFVIMYKKGNTGE